MANALLTIIVLVALIGCIAVMVGSVIVILIAIYFYFKGGKRISSWEIIYKEMKELAKLNYDPMMRQLYRLDMPSMGEYVRILNSLLNLTKPEVKALSDEQKTLAKSLQSKLDTLNSNIGRNNRGIYKGEITGFNRMNLYTSFTDLYQPDGNKPDSYVMRFEDVEGNPREQHISIDEYNGAKEVLERCGNFINIIVYEVDYGWKIPLLWRNKVERALLCFDDQISGRDSTDGKVVILATGFETHGIFFEIPADFQDRTKVILSAMTSLTWIRTITQTQGNILEVVNNSLNINPVLLQGLAIKHAEKPAKQVTQKA